MTAPLLPSLPHGYGAAVVGATGAIGAAVADALISDPRLGALYRLGRSISAEEGIALDVTDEASVGAAAARLKEQGARLNLLFIATGGLIIDGSQPEKALRQIEAEALAAQFALNAIGPALVLKHFSPLLDKQGRCLVGALSARVGSVGDNRLGGWIGYRSAKAALNQILKTASVELARTHPQSVVAALHPGTVESPLTRPFRPAGAGTDGVMTPKQSAERLLGVLDGLTPGDSGGFWDWRGDPVEW